MESLKVPGNLESLNAIAQYVLTAAKEANLDKKSTYNLRLAVDEIATNIIIYGYEEAGIQGDIEIHADIQTNALTITLEDNALAFDPTQQKIPEDLDLSLEVREIGGLGVYLAFQGVDEFKYQRIGDRNHNIFVVHRQNNS